MYYYINGVQMPSFTSFEPDSENLYDEEGTGRDEVGDMQLELVKADVKKWRIEHRMINGVEVQLIERSINPLGFMVKADAGGRTVNCKCYGNAKKKLKFVEGKGPENMYYDVNVTLVQME